uniref:RING-type E3 ubiquitin transferase n=1 Tax=Kalanchoe fedtschenkoi TaxID=63787 RepID=A0A7N0TA18_KALFE
MDENSNRRAVKGHPDSRRVFTSVSKKAPRTITQATQLGSQLGCGNRPNIAKSKIICSENLNTSSYRYAESGKRVVGGSSLSSSSSSSSTRRLWEARRKVPPNVEKVLPESASGSGSGDGSIVHESEVTKDIFLSESEHPDTVYTSKKEFILDTVSSPRVRPQKNVIGKPELTDLVGSSGASSSRSKALPSTIPRLSQSSSKYVSKKPVESRVNKRMELLRKGNVEGESSSSGGKKTSPLRIGENSGLPSGKSIAKIRKHLHYSRRDTDVASVSSQRSNPPISRSKPSAQEYGGISTPNESNVITGHEVPVSISTLCVSDTNSSGNFTAHPIIDGNRTSSVDLGFTSEMVNQAASPHHMDGITEIILFLEQIIQMMMSDQRSILRDMNSLRSLRIFHDQHRDMRLDIDNMSYEELLALGERIGSVSTALTEEAMDKCLTKSLYNPSLSDGGSIGFNQDEDDLKCCICQEEYVVGDEVGRLHCRHLYHLGCIRQWLSQKNWCPVCKKSAVPP